MQNGNTLCWLRCQASTTRQRGLPRSWWRSQTKWFAAARGSSPRVAVSLSGTRLLVDQHRNLNNVHNWQRVSSGAGSDWEQADPVHPVEYRLQRGVPEDQEQEGAMDVLDVSLLHFPKVVKKAKEFSFSEKYIFGRFDSFCMRLRCEIPNMMESSIFCRNLLKMFSTINQFTSLFNSRTEVCDRKIADEIQFCRNRLCKFSAVPIGCSKAFGSFIPK